MAWNLGLLGAAGADGPAGAYDLLETTILSSDATSVSFTGLGAYTGYKHLQIRMTGRTDRNSGSDNLMIQFNNDTGSNYAWHLLVGNGSSVNSFNSTSTTALRSCYAGTNTSAPDFGVEVFDILDAFSTTKYKTTRDLTGIAGAAGDEVQFYSGLWMNTSALSEIDIFPLLGANITTGSRFSLYGMGTP